MNNLNENDIKVKNVTTQVDIKLLAEFERQAHITEPDIWIEEFCMDGFLSKYTEEKILELKNNKIVVAMCNDKIVGRCDVLVTTSTVDFMKTGYIDWIYVLKDYRGKGIGKKLFEGAESFFKDKNVSKYYLFTADNKQAQTFYHKQKSFNFEKREVAEKELDHKK